MILAQLFRSQGSRRDSLASICEGAGGVVNITSYALFHFQGWGIRAGAWAWGEYRVATACLQHLVFLTSKSGVKGCVYGQTAGE